MTAGPAYGDWQGPVSWGARQAQYADERTAATATAAPGNTLRRTSDML
jgi:hypothetical protein